MPAPSSTTSRTPWAVKGLLAVSFALPLWVGECLPWTDAALFTDAQPRFARYEVIDAATGRRWPAGHARLALRYVGLRGDSARYPQPAPGALRRAATANRWGEVLDEAGIRAAVAPAWSKGGPPEAVVTQHTYGALGDGRVGRLHRRTCSG